MNGKLVGSMNLYKTPRFAHKKDVKSKRLETHGVLYFRTIKISYINTILQADI